MKKEIEELNRILNIIKDSETLLDGEYYIIHYDFIHDLQRVIEEISNKKGIEYIASINRVDGSSDLTALSQMQYENNKKFMIKINEIIEHINKE